MALKHHRARLVGGLLLLSSCASPGFHLPPHADLKTHDYPTGSAIEADDVRYLRPYNKLPQVEFVVLRVKASEGEARYENFLRHALQDLGFSQVLNDKEFEKVLVQTGVTEHLTLSDYFTLNGLHKVATFTPTFLYIESSFHCRTLTCEQHLAVIDPVNSEYLLSMDRSRTVWTSLDGDLNYPLVNLIRRWYLASMESVDISDSRALKGASTR